MREDRHYGAPVERGRIKEGWQDGYIVESLSRPGLTSRRIETVSGSTELTAGAQVFFCLFPDGSGVILA